MNKHVKFLGEKRRKGRRKGRRRIEEEEEEEKEEEEEEEEKEEEQEEQEEKTEPKEKFVKNTCITHCTARLHGPGERCNQELQRPPR